MSKVIDITSRLQQKKQVVEQEDAYVPTAYDEETEEIVNGWINTLLDEMEELDVADESAEFSRDFIFATEAIRSLVYRNRGTAHFIQQVADQMIDVSYDEETDMIEGVWNFDDGNSILYTEKDDEE